MKTDLSPTCPDVITSQPLLKKKLSSSQRKFPASTWGRPVPSEFSPSPSGFTLIELLVSITLIAALVALVLPAIQSSREAARRSLCQNNLRQIGLGLLQFHDVHKEYPVGCIECRRYQSKIGRQLAWSAHLLPYVEQKVLYNRLNLSKSFDDPVNSEPASSLLSVYVCPSSDLSLSIRNSDRGPIHYGGIFGEMITTRNQPPKGVMLIDQAVSIPEILDGTSFTLIVAEDSRFPDGEWINGKNIFDQAYAVNSPKADPTKENDIRSEHPGGAYGLTCSGSVHFLTETMDEKVLAALCTRAGNEPIGDWK